MKEDNTRNEVDGVKARASRRLTVGLDLGDRRQPVASM